MARRNNMVSFVRSAEEKAEAMMPSIMSMDSNPDVPSGLCLCLDGPTMEKLGLDSNPERGDLLHMMIMVQVTAVHSDMGGERVECAIIGGRVEDESKETMDDMADEDEDE